MTTVLIGIALLAVGAVVTRGFGLLPRRRPGRDTTPPMDHGYAGPTDPTSGN